MATMRAFVITLKNHDYSEQVANRCIASAETYGVSVEKFYGVNKQNAIKTMQEFGLKWTWADNNTRMTYCPITYLRQHPYGNVESKIGCSMSHFLLWRKCVELDEPILILEHDSIFIRKLPEFDFTGICQINDPNGATRKGKWWSDQMKQRGIKGVHEKTWVTTPQERMIPDGLAGNSAYVIKPWAAQELISAYYRLGVWPNDATMCKQLFPYLQEYYPFITKVKQEFSTSSL